MGQIPRLDPFSENLVTLQTQPNRFYEICRAKQYAMDDFP
jgi:hypothetical protein